MLTVKLNTEGYPLRDAKDLREAREKTLQAKGDKTPSQFAGASVYQEGWRQIATISHTGEVRAMDGKVIEL